MIATSRGALGVALAFAASTIQCSGCKDKSTAVDPVEASASSAPQSLGTPMTAMPSTPLPSHPHPRAPCRAMGVKGSAGITEGSAIPAGLWIDVAQGAAFTAKDPVTARETTFEGPGRVRPCVHGEEESWVASGVFTTVTGTTAPGHEEWIVTPFSVVRYAAATLKVAVTVDEKTNDVEVVVTSGVAHVWHRSLGGNPDTDAEGWLPVKQGAAWRLGKLAPPLDEASTFSLLATCEQAAKASHELAARIQDPAARADGGFGDLVTRQIVLRRVAHAACAIPGLRAAFSTVKDGPALAARLQRAEAAWRSAE